jgi:hypothetical protein
VGLREEQELGKQLAIKIASLFPLRQYEYRGFYSSLMTIRNPAHETMSSLFGIVRSSY